MALFNRFYYFVVTLLSASFPRIYHVFRYFSCCRESGLDVESVDPEKKYRKFFFGGF